VTGLPATLWRAWDRASIYLPVILMALMALGTYWLARNTPSFITPGVSRPLAHEPDYFMRGFSVKNFDPAGRLKSEIHGQEARHFPDTDTMEIDLPRIRSFNEAGVLTVATAKKAISNGDGSEVQLLGDAVVTREVVEGAKAASPKMEIRGEFLHVFVQAEKVKSHKPVQLKRGDDEFHADQLDYSNLDRVLELTGRVRGVIGPRKE
jgi:lipopolysaccharide export system protein LptC